jgi:1-pyrroline-5-carboxylate dehydrogenase
MHFILPCADAQHSALQTMRGAFEYSGQKCSATSRVYVPDNLWETFESAILKEHTEFNIGPVDGK